MFVSFLDASMAFDNLCHYKLLVCVRWNGKISEYFCVTNGVRQGGLLSPLLYNVYAEF